MADFSKDIVKQLKETNKRLGILEKQGTEEGTPKEIIKQAVPEVLATRRWPATIQRKEGLLKVDDLLIKQAKNQKIWNEKNIID